MKGSWEFCKTMIVGHGNLYAPNGKKYNVEYDEDKNIAVTTTTARQAVFNPPKYVMEMIIVNIWGDGHEMKKVGDDVWKHLSNDVKTILERIDINKKNASIPIGSIVDIPYFKGKLTNEMAEEIVQYQYSKDNEGYFSAEIIEGVLNIRFIKQAI